MEEKNFLEKNKTLLVLLGFSSILLILFSAISGRGLFFDIPAKCLSLLEKQTIFARYMFHHVMEPDNFSNRLLALPYNILLPIFDNSPLSKLNLFTFSCLFSTFLATVFNFVIAKRTNKFEIASFALLFYALFTIPASIVPTEPVYIAIPIFFIFLQYFFTEEKLCRFDYLLILLISGYLFQSSIYMAIPAALLFFSGVILFFKGHVKHWKVKLYMSLSSLAAALFMAYKMFFFIDKEGNSCVSFNELSYTFQNSLYNILDNFFTCEMIFSAIAILFLCYGLFAKKDFGKAEALTFAILSTFALYSIYEFTKFVPHPSVNLDYYAITTVVFVIIVATLIITFLANIKMNSNKVCNTIIATACFCGILQCLIQYGNCIHALEYKTFIKNKVNSAVGFVTINDEDYQKNPFLALDTPEYTIIRSLFVSDKDAKTIIIPNLQSEEKNKSYIGYNDVDHAYNDDHAYIIIQSLYFPMKSKDWNLNEIIPLLKKLK